MHTRLDLRIAIAGFGWFCVAAALASSGWSGVREMLDPGYYPDQTPWWTWSMWALAIAPLAISVVSLVSNIAYMTRVPWGAPLLRSLTRVVLAYATASLAASVIGWGIVAGWSLGAAAAALFDSATTIAVALFALALLPLIRPSSESISLPVPA